MVNKYRVTNKKVFITVRVIVRFSEEGYIAETIDAGAIGMGETQDQALRELFTSLEELWQASGAAMKIKASEEDERIFKLLMAHKQTNDPTIVSFVHVERFQMTIESTASKPNVTTRPAFDIAELQPAA